MWYKETEAIGFRARRFVKHTSVRKYFEIHFQQK